MKTTSELLLSFLLNACWQIMLIAAVAALGDLLLRRTVARYRHMLWVAALFLSLFLPLATSGNHFNSARAAAPRPEVAIASLPIAGVSQSSVPTLASSAKSALQIDARLAAGLLAVYLLFLLYRGVKLFRAWARTRAASAVSTAIEPDGRIQDLVANCQKAIGVASVSLVSSASLRAPATVGIFRPLVILPDNLVREAGAEALTAAIGHELVHVLRRDYLLNLIYEIVFLPLSFHPAAALMRRRITQTRELRCDELVTELLLRPEVYARSLVQLAGSAMPFNRRERTLTVGIADADILEVRVMSLLGKTRLSVRRNRFLLIAALVLLALPCAAAASFRFHVNVNESLSQEPDNGRTNQRERKARLIYHTEAEYTADARAKNIEGTVGLSITVGTDGLVSDVKVTKSLYPSLDQSAVAAASIWRFEPYIKDGQPTPKQLSVEVYFNPQYDKRAREDQEKKERAEREVQELRQKIERETNSEVRAKLEAELRQKEAAPESVGVIIDGKGYALTLRRNQDAEGWQSRKAALSRLARISMDQAIQIATSQSPGKVSECSLVGEHWEGEGESAKPGLVLYDVVILSGDEAKPTVTHVLVNAVDGTILRTSKEERRREEGYANQSGERRATTQEGQVINGGVLNGKATNLPAPA